MFINKSELIQDMERASFKKEQQRIFDALAQQPPLFLRSIGREREHRLGYNFYRYLYYVKTKNIFDEINFKPGELILDIGCNDGELLNALYLAYKIKGVGIDFSMEALKRAGQYNFSGSRYYFGDADNLPFKDNSFDGVICFSLLEHLPEVGPCVREIKRVLRNGGQILIYAFNSNYRYTWSWFKKRIFLSRYDYDRGGGQAHNPAYFINSLDFRERLETEAMKVKKIIYFHSFFTMLYDDLGQRTIYRLVCLLYLLKSRLIRYANPEKIKPDIILRLYNWWLSGLLPLFELLDNPLTSRGYSKGFYLLGEKAE